MKFIISGKNLDVTDGLKSNRGKNFGKFERYFTRKLKFMLPECRERKTENRDYDPCERKTS